VPASEAQIAEALVSALPDGLRDVLTDLDAYMTRRPSPSPQLLLIRPQQSSDFLGEWHHALHACAASGWAVPSLVTPWKALTPRYEATVPMAAAAAALLPFHVPTGQLNALTEKIRSLHAAARTKSASWHARSVALPVLSIFSTRHHAYPPHTLVEPTLGDGSDAATPAAVASESGSGGMDTDAVWHP
jgi:hypothetical protein